MRPSTRNIVVSLAILGLLCGLFHYRPSASDDITCAFCHAGAQIPSLDLACVLTVPFLEVQRTVSEGAPASPALLRQVSTEIPRAPPLFAVAEYVAQVKVGGLSGLA